MILYPYRISCSSPVQSAHCSQENAPVVARYFARAFIWGNVRIPHPLEQKDVEEMVVFIEIIVKRLAESSLELSV